MRVFNFTLAVLATTGLAIAAMIEFAVNISIAMTQVMC